MATRTYVTLARYLLVRLEGCPVNPVTLTVFGERARLRRLLRVPDIDPVEIVDIEELEMIEGIQEESGPSMLDILRDQQSGGLCNAVVRDHILHGNARRRTAAPTSGPVPPGVAASHGDDAVRCLGSLGGVDPGGDCPVFGMACRTSRRRQVRQRRAALWRLLSAPPRRTSPSSGSTIRNPATR